MAKFIFEMPDELAARVEAWRGDHRLKFTAEAVRQLIERGLGDDAAPAPKTVVVGTERQRVDVIAPKRGRPEASKLASRLKGEWKAP